MQNPRLLVTIFAVVSIFLLAPLTYAQDNSGIKLVPATIEESANPGDVLRQTLKVTNDSNTEKEYYIYKKNIKGVGTGGVPIFAEDNSEQTGYEIAEWIEIPTEKLLVAPQQTVDLDISINVPSNATPGSHFGGVFVSVEPPKLRTIGAGVGYEIASIVSIRISGPVSDIARIRSFSTDKLFYSKKDVTFTARIENQGNILIRPRGPVTITSMFGTKPEGFTVNENLAGVFPGTMRDIEFAWKSDGIGFGRYEAILALVYEGDGGQKTIDASLIFWVFPTKIMLTILGLFLGIFALGYVFTKYYINQAIMRAAGGRRIQTQRYRKQAGISRFAFVSIVLMGVVVILLILMLIFFA